MNEQDFELLRRFIRRGDQAAFEALVRRHLDLVYATAWRKLEDSGAAEEVAQNVFAALARKAWQFARDSSLPAWLHRCALLEAKNWLRGELRRRRREQAAAELGTTMKTPDDQTAVRALVPLLDEALLSLRESDRTALLLRYYENRSLREVGGVLGVGEDAAQKRVAAAVERLTRFFQLRGYRTATVAEMAATLQQTAVSAPEFVAVSVTRAALPFAASTLIGSKALLAPLLGLTKVQKTAAVILLVLTPLATHWARQAWPAAPAPDGRQQADASSPPASASPKSASGPRMMLSPSSALAEQAASVAAAMARRDPQEEIEYNVELRGLAELPDWKGALLAVHHRSLDVSNGPPFIVKKLLRPGDAFDDQSIRGGYVRLELLRVEAKTGSARVRANKTEFTVGMDDPAQPALAQNDAPLALIFKEPLEFYGELTERTILCHPTLKTNVFPFAARARDRTEAIRILEQALREHGIVIAYESEHFALALPVNLVKSVTAQLRAMEAPAWSNRGEEEILAKGSILMENASLDQVMGLYGALAGRKWVGKDAVSCHPLTVHSQTPLSKAETLHALDILLLWNGLRTVPVGNNDFRIARLPRH